MSAPFELTASDLRRVATFLDRVTAASAQVGIHLVNCPTVEVDGTQLEIVWDSITDNYRLNESVG